MGKTFTTSTTPLDATVEPQEAPAQPLPSIEPTPVKPGLKTTELYTTLLVVLPLMAKLLSLDLNQDSIDTIAYIVALAAPAAFAVWSYVKHRTEVKQTAIVASS